MSEIAISAKGLGKTFGNFVAVQNVTLELPAGNLLALLGPNGAGKTTTVRMLASILQPSRGKAVIAGYDSVADADRVRGLVGLLTEQPGLYGRMNAVDYLDFFGELQGVPQAVRQKRTRELLERFSLWEHRTRAIGTFSKGMRQKVSLCRALIHDPQIVFLDEPTSGLDPSGGKIVRDYIEELKARGRTVIVCTHNLSEIEMYADHIAILKKGVIIAEGSIGTLKRSLLGAPVFEIRVTQPLPGGWDMLYEDSRALFHSDPEFSIQNYGPTWVRYSTAVPECTNPQLLRTLIEQGADVVSLAEVPKSLESVYLSIIHSSGDAGQSTLPQT